MNKSKKVWIQFSIVTVLLLSLIGIAVAWFVNYKYNRLNAPKIQIVAGDYMEIYGDGQKWNNQLVVQASKLRWDITGDGVDLWRPKIDDTGAAPDLTEQDNWTRATKDPYEGELLDFIEVPVSLRSDRPMKIYLGANSTVTPICEQGKSLYSSNPDGDAWDKVENASNFSTSSVRFSRNYIAGAVRVAILQNMGTEENASLQRMALWVPNPDYQLITSPSYDFAANGTAESSYTYYTYAAQDGTAQKTLNTWDAGDVKSVFTTGNADTPDESDYVMTMVKNETDGMYYASLVVRIWIEGTDREARLALAGGEFDVNLQFVASPAAQAASGQTR